MTEIGLIFHWGLYSVPAFDDPDSVSRRRTFNGSEWYQARLLEKGTYRPISGYKETQKYHHEQYHDAPYDDFQDQFKAELWNPQQWMDIAKSINATYVILTAKHHDGYCLWNTKTTKRNSMKTGSHSDLLERFAECAKKNGLKFGIYYSWMEFDANVTINYIDNIVVPQVTELIEYNPDIWWFDGSWKVKSKYAINAVHKLISVMKLKNSKVEINDRIPENLGMTYNVFADRYLPNQSINSTIPWEHINTIGYSWGANKMAKEYKSGKELHQLYSKVRSLNGKFLLNVGPLANGTILPQELQSLNELSTILLH